jgi:hypothetical protein
MNIGCRGSAHHHYRIFWPFKELLAKQPHLVAKVMASNPDGGFPTTRFPDGDYAIVSNVYACEQCCKTIEKELAKGPSWVLVEKVPVFQMPGTLTKKVMERVGSDFEQMRGHVIKEPTGPRSGLVDAHGRGVS